MGRMTLEDALKREADRMGGSSFLSNWKEKGEIVLWLHCSTDFWARYTHQFPFIDVREDRETRKVKRVLRSLRFGCLELDQINEKRRWRDPVTGERKVPPEICPFCLLVEHLRTSGLPDDAVVFTLPEARGNDGKAIDVTYRKGNITGEAERTKDSWREDLQVRETVLFAAVDNGAVKDGVKIADEAYLVGSKILQVIRHEKDSKGDQEGNPLMTPYAIKVEFNEKAKNPSDKYVAFRYERAKLTDEIGALIRDPAQVPDLGSYCQPGQAATLRAYMEEALKSADPAAVQALGDLDLFFAKAVAMQEDQPETTTGKQPGKRPDNSVSKTRVPAQAQPAAAAAPAAQVPGRRKKADPPKPAAVQTIPCDDCKAPMLPTDTVCAKCGAKYEVDSTPAATPAPAPAAEPPQDDDIPF